MHPPRLGGGRVILTERSEVVSESRRQPAVSVARATGPLGSLLLFVAVVAVGRRDGPGVA